jgi:anti-sigma regulatory factor (Ser/Thr protein kinase)
MTASFKRELKSLEILLEFLDSFMTQHRVGASVKPTLFLAVDEMFTNMVRHQPNASNEITVTVEEKEGSIIVRLFDPGANPFDLTKTKDPDFTVPMNERSPGGLGIYLTRKLMDEVRYEHRDDRAVVTLVKKLED